MVCERLDVLPVKRRAILFSDDINQQKNAQAQVYDQRATNNVGEKLSSHFMSPSFIRSTVVGSQFTVFSMNYAKTEAFWILILMFLSTFRLC